MMTEKELVGKIRELRQIKPNQDWVVLTKNRILGGEEKHTSLISIFRVIFFKPAYVCLIFIFVLLGLFGIAQNSLPGDLLYPIKKITEKSQAVFVPQREQPKLNLELANKRLEELTKIAQTNQVRKLAPAINEYQTSVSEAAKNLNKIAANTSDPSIIKEIAEKAQKLIENEEKVKSLGVIVDESKDFKENIQALVSRQIEIWKIQINNLSDEIEKKKELESMLEKAEEYYKAEDYYNASQVLEEIYLSYPQL